VTSITLEHSRYRVITATRGNEALALLREHRAEIAVVVSDLSMPGLARWEMRAIARQEGMAVPFVFTSGHAPGDVFPAVVRRGRTTSYSIHPRRGPEAPCVVSSSF
jgi:CheY-like chemotaxis protein